MNSPPPFNMLPLLSVREQLDDALGRAGQALAQYFADAGNGTAVLRGALDELRRLHGVLQALSLDGLVVYCGALEKLLQELADGALPPAGMHRDAIGRALDALAHYLDALAGGAPNAALRLFGPYQEIMRMRGIEAASEMDLFFPALDVELPAAVRNAPAAASVPDCIRPVRIRYQQALLKWLRRNDVAGSLQSMRTEVAAAMACVQPQHRAFWWVAGGLLDCLLHEGLPPELDARKILGRIDLGMKVLADGMPLDARATLYEMLYLVACSYPVSGTVDAIRHIYALDSCLPQAPLPAGEIEQVLGQMRVQLQAAEAAWEKCTHGEHAACREFGDQAGRLHTWSGRLARNTLQYLCRQIHHAAGRCEDPEQVQRLAMDMAMALLLLGDGLAHYGRLDHDFHQQSRILVRRLQLAMAGMPQDAQDLEHLVRLHCRAAGRDAMAPLANELRETLHDVELGLGAFFDNPERRDELARFGRMLNQVQGGLLMLSQEMAGQLLGALESVVGYYAGGASPSQEEAHTIAAAIDALQAYLHELVDGREPDSAALEGMLLSVRSLQQPIAVQAGEASAAGMAAGGEDELLEVFIEEAQDVLQSLDGNRESSRLYPESTEPLAAMRRGFHTLKGSGRMVGLRKLSEAAGVVEHAINKWLQQDRPATPALLGFIAEAQALFQGWVDMLIREGQAAVDAGELEAMARQLEARGDAAELQDRPEAGLAQPEALSAVDAAATELPTIEPAAQPDSDTIRVGAVSLSPALFGIATEEAASYVAKLQRHLADLRENDQQPVRYDFMRAAHTLAGISRTMGFMQVAELSEALELWLEQRIDKAVVLDAGRLALLEQSVAALEAMCRGIREQQLEPARQPELIARLQADRHAWQSAAPTGAGINPPAMPEGGRTAIAPQIGQVTEVRMVQDDVDEQLLPIFLEEADDLYPQIGARLRDWRDQSGDGRAGHYLQRLLHTLKGSARMAGVMRLGELTHRMEDCVVAAMSRERPDEGQWQELEDYFDRVGNVLEQLRGTPALPGMEAEATLPDPGAGRTPSAAMLRVRSDTIDRLVNEAGEISVTRARAETELRAFRDSLLELTDSVGRLRSQLREIEIQAESRMEAGGAKSPDLAEKFDPLELDRFSRFQELTRFLNESVHDVQTVQQGLLKNLDEANAALSAQARLSRDLQHGLMEIRMVPFSSIGERLFRVVRQTAKETGKQARLELVGAEVGVDRSVLERMAAPFEHMLRNAVSHGLERPEQRERLGKPPAGEIRLALSQENNELVFELGDDGAGIDIEGLRQRALQQGLAGTDGADGDEQALQLIFASGVSTAAEVTEISGRGIGMDVVRSEIRGLGGRIDVSSVPGKGTRFRIHLPLTLAVTQVLMVRAGGENYAIPSVLVEQVMQARPDMLQSARQAGQVEWQGGSYPLCYLPQLLGDAARMPESGTHSPVLLLRSGEQRMALQVDELEGNQEAVVKNVGPQLARLPGITGATVLSNGRVVLILNPVALEQRPAAGCAGAEPGIVAPAPPPLPLVMVVDDSLTVRKITSRMLSRAGYRVVTAKDGLDALEKLTQVTPAVILLDIEMPRMDGFEFTRQVRRDPHLQALPIIMVTSRSADKHRNHALGLGVNACFGKPYQEEELLRQIAIYTALPEE